MEVVFEASSVVGSVGYFAYASASGTTTGTVVRTPSFFLQFGNTNVPEGLEDASWNQIFKKLDANGASKKVEAIAYTTGAGTSVAYVGF